ncbi:hypothetical protein VTN77DRAFT_2493 [Rasamsonia byssochlamydoides]|uniref:uncharacterized protein n=1 Tax=Rasamsonia byssochlamydoides TaxID=89139 RepID=UPI0037424639
MLARSMRRLFSTSTFRMATQTTNTSSTPVEDAIREKLTPAFSPTTLIIRNDSHLHAHHAAMQGSTSKETHFHVTITSDAFQSKPQPARHRMVYALLKDEMSREGGIHALQLRTRTPEEEQKQMQTEQQP